MMPADLDQSAEWLMTQFVAGKLMRLITIAAMVVQLGIVAFHHHPDEKLGERHAHAWSIASATIKADTHAGHDHDHHHGPVEADHGDDQQNPGDGDLHDCDLCLFKTNVASAIHADGSGGLWIAPPSTKLHFVHRDASYRDFISERYRARAPPIELLIS